MNPKRYILKGKKPIKEPRLIQWALWLETANRTIGLDRIENPYAKGSDDTHIVISTIFTGIDYGFGITRIPLLFETMIFFGELDGEIARTSSWAQAEEAHQTAIRRVKESIAIRETEKKVEDVKSENLCNGKDDGAPP